jgi:hypothetical protein
MASKRNCFLMLVSHEAVAGLWILWNEHGNKVEAPLMFGAVNPLQKGKRFQFQKNELNIFNCLLFSSGYLVDRNDNLP